MHEAGDAERFLLGGDVDAVRTVVSSGLDVFAHNVETVERLQRVVRDHRAGYKQSLTVLETAKKERADVVTKSSIMLGVGESAAEVMHGLALNCPLNFY